MLCGSVAMCCQRRVRRRSTRPACDAEFIFLAHGDSYVNALSINWWSSRYSRLNTKEQFEEMWWFEKYVLAAIVSFVLRLCTLLGCSRLMNPKRIVDEQFQLWFPMP